MGRFLSGFVTFADYYRHQEMDYCLIDSQADCNDVAGLVLAWPGTPYEDGGDVTIAISRAAGIKPVVQHIRT